MRTAGKVGVVVGVVFVVIILVFVSALDRELLYMIWLDDLSRAGSVEEIDDILGRMLTLGLHDNEADLAFERAGQRAAELEGP